MTDGRLELGDRVRVTCEGRTIPAVVVMVSDDRRSAFLHFDGVLGGYVASMPVLFDEATGGYRSLFGALPVTVNP